MCPTSSNNAKNGVITSDFTNVQQLHGLVSAGAAKKMRDVSAVIDRIHANSSKNSKDNGDSSGFNTVPQLHGNHA